MAKVIGFVVALIGVFWLAIAGWYARAWWDTRPAHFPELHMKLGPFPVHLTAPDSLRAQRDAARAALGSCYVLVGTQNASIDRLKAEDEAASRAATLAARKADKAVQHAQSAAAHILSVKPGSDLCVSAFDVLKGDAG